MAIEETNEKLAVIEANLVEVDDKMTALVTLVQELRDAGDGATAAEVAEINVRLEAIKNKLQGVEDKEDSTNLP